MRSIQDSIMMLMFIIFFDFPKISKLIFVFLIQAEYQYSTCRRNY
jgi:hypothetical protein